MIETMSEKEVYLSQQAQFERGLGERDPDWLRHMREAATERFAELGFPTARHEDWKFTNVAPLVKVPFQVPPTDSPKSVESYRLLTHGDSPGATLICMNGNRPFLASWLMRYASMPTLSNRIWDSSLITRRRLSQL